MIIMETRTGGDPSSSEFFSHRQFDTMPEENIITSNCNVAISYSKYLPFLKVLVYLQRPFS